MSASSGGQGFSRRSRRSVCLGQSTPLLGAGISPVFPAWASPLPGTAVPGTLPGLWGSRHAVWPSPTTGPDEPSQLPGRQETKARDMPGTSQVTAMHSLLFLYCSSIVPLFLASFAALNSAAPYWRLGWGCLVATTVSGPDRRGG